MSATAANLELPVAGLDHDRRPGLARLTGVELRKMVDTRAGFWLQLFNLGLMIAFVVVALILADAQTGRSRTSCGSRCGRPARCSPSSEFC